MHTNLSKRLLAGLMSVVMVLSLIAVAPTTEAKAATETLEIDLDSLDLNELGATYGSVENLASLFDHGSFTSLGGDFDEPEVTVSDSDGELDPDDTIYPGVAYTVNVKYTETEKGAAAKVKAVKINYTNEKGKAATKSLSKTSGNGTFSFSYKFKEATKAVAPACLTKVGKGMATISKGVKKSARTALATDNCVKSSVAWTEIAGDFDADKLTMSAKGASYAATTKTPQKFDNGTNTYLAKITLTASKGFIFDFGDAAAFGKASEANAKINAYADGLKDGLNYMPDFYNHLGYNFGAYTFVGYTADTKNVDELVLYYTVKSCVVETSIYEATLPAAHCDVALTKPTSDIAATGTGSLTLGNLINAAGISKTISFKDEDGKTVTFDVEWRADAAGGQAVSENDIFNHQTKSIGAGFKHDDVITLTGQLKQKANKVEFEDYDFSNLGLSIEKLDATYGVLKDGAENALTVEVKCVNTKVEDAKVMKTLSTPKVSWKDSAKRVKATSAANSTIEVTATYLAPGKTGVVGTYISGKYNTEDFEEADTTVYVKGGYCFQALPVNAEDAEAETKLQKTYGYASGKYLVYYTPAGFNQTKKDGDVDFEVNGNPVSYEDFYSDDTVTCDADSSDASSVGSGFYSVVSPSLYHSCTSGSNNIVLSDTVYTLNMYYFVGRSEDEVGDMIPSKWRVYLNGDDITSSAKTGYMSKKDGFTVLDENGYYAGKLYGYYFMVTKTFEKTTEEIASADNEKTLYVNAPAPTVGQNVTTANITASHSTSNYVTVGETKWADEDGNAVTGQIEDDKAYTATVTLTAKDGYVFGDTLTEETAIGDNEEKGHKFLESVEYDEEANAVTLTYNYEADAITYDKVTGANAQTIKLDAGASYDDIMTALDDVKTTINFANGGTAVAETTADTDKGSFATQWEKLGYVNTFVEGSDKTQTLTFYGAVDLTPYETDDFTYDDEATFVITVKVGAGTTLTIDANGGNITVPTSYEVEKDAVLSSAYTYVAGTITKAGYNFAGFYDAAEGGNRVYLSTAKIDKDTTIYAHWTKVFTGWTKNVKAASYSAGRLTVSWDVPVTGAAGYQVRIATSSDMSNATVVGGFNKTVKYYTALKTGTRYYVQVRAYRNDSTGARVFSAWSTTTSAVVK